MRCASPDIFQVMRISYADLPVFRNRLYDAGITGISLYIVSACSGITAGGVCLRCHIVIYKRSIAGDRSAIVLEEILYLRHVGFFEGVLLNCQLPFRVYADSKLLQRLRILCRLA